MPPLSLVPPLSLAAQETRDRQCTGQGAAHAPPFPHASPTLPSQVKNPATGKVLARMPLMRADETRTAIASAHAVFPQVLEGGR